MKDFNIENGVDLVSTAINTIFKTLGGLVMWIIGGLAVAFAFGVIIGAVIFPILTVVFLFLPNKNLEQIWKPITGSYMWLRIKSSLVCSILTIICWKIIEIANRTAGL